MGWKHPYPQTTTGQITTTPAGTGLSVPDVFMDHQAAAPAPGSMVWVSAPVPICLNEVAALLFDCFPGPDLDELDVAYVRQFVVLMVIGVGFRGISDTQVVVRAALTNGDADARWHWERCRRLAGEAFAEILTAAPVPAPRRRRKPSCPARRDASPPAVRDGSELAAAEGAR